MNMKLPAYRMLLYTDTIGGKQVSRDDMWVLTTNELNKIDAELSRLRALVSRAGDVEGLMVAIRDAKRTGEAGGDLLEAARAVEKFVREGK